MTEKKSYFKTYDICFTQSYSKILYVAQYIYIYIYIVGPMREKGNTLRHLQKINDLYIFGIILVLFFITFILESNLW